MHSVLRIPVFLLALALLQLACQKELSYEGGAELPAATGSLHDSLGNCAPLELSGHFYKGIAPPPSSYYIRLQLQVDQPGSYRLNTGLVNGFGFADSGRFNSPGLQTIILRPYGIPERDSVTPFRLSFGNSVCNFSIDVQDTLPVPAAGNGPALNSWQFYDSTDGTYHSGIIDTSRTTFDVNALWNNLKISGWPVNPNGINKDTLFNISLFLPQPIIQTGTFDINSGVGGSHSFSYANRDFWVGSGANQYFCYYLSTPAIDPGFQFSLLRYDSSTHILSGRFWGFSRRITNHNDYVGSTDKVSGSFYLQLP